MSKSVESSGETEKACNGRSITLNDVFAGAFPYVLIMILVLVLVVIFPGISLVLVTTDLHLPKTAIS